MLLDVDSSSADRQEEPPKVFNKALFKRLDVTTRRRHRVALLRPAAVRRGGRVQQRAEHPVRDRRHAQADRGGGRTEIAVVPPRRGRRREARGCARELSGATSALADVALEEWRLRGASTSSSGVGGGGEGWGGVWWVGRGLAWSRRLRVLEECWRCRRGRHRDARRGTLLASSPTVRPFRRRTSDRPSGVRAFPLNVGILEVVTAEHLTPNMRRLVLTGEGIGELPVEEPGRDPHAHLAGSGQRHDRPARAAPLALPGWRRGAACPQHHDSRPRSRARPRHHRRLPAWRRRTRIALGARRDGRDAVGVRRPARTRRTEPAADWTLLIGDETGLPAIGAIVEQRPAGQRTLAVIEVESGAEEQALQQPRRPPRPLGASRRAPAGLRHGTPGRAYER